MKNILTILSTITMAILLNTGIVVAAGETYGTNQCQPIYGGGESCPKVPQIEINKLVRNPETNIYVDNLGVSDPKYAPESTINFKVTVKNTSDRELTKLVIKDVFPNVVDFTNGIGNYDSNSKTLTIDLDSLKPGETRDFYFETKVVDADKLPKDQGVICVINQSNVTVEGKTAQDNAQFCIEKNLKPKNPPTTKGGKPVFPPSEAKTTPETGPEAIALIGLIPTAAAGFALRRKSK